MTGLEQPISLEKSDITYNDTILKLLNELQNYEIDILYAIEAGSRSWGFESTDSDYDIRFIYKHSVDWYLKICQCKDTIDLTSGDYDLHGWDIRKAVSLGMNSNANLTEWLNSPIVYINKNNFRETFRNLIFPNINLFKIFKSYNGLAVKHYYTYLKDNDTPKIKKLLYTIRCLACCVFIRKYEKLPDIKFEDVIKVLPDSIQNDCNKLVKLKLESETKTVNKQDFESFINYITNYTKEDNVFEFKTKQNPPIDLLNKFLIEKIRGVSD